MQQLRNLNKLANAAGMLRDITQHTKVYTFAITSPPVTFYLQSENTLVRVLRWSKPVIEVTAQLQGAFGWRVVTDQDEVGVYMVAKRRILVGELSSARLDVRLPRDTYLAFDLTGCDVLLKNINGALALDPPAPDLLTAESPPLLPEKTG